MEKICQKYFQYKNFLAQKKNFGPINFYVKKILSPKKFWSKNFLSKNI